MQFYRFVLNEPFIDNTGPSLGSLTIFTKTFERLGNPVLTPIWRLYNHQGPEWRYAQAQIPETTDTLVRFVITPIVWRKVKRRPWKG